MGKPNFPPNIFPDVTASLSHRHHSLEDVLSQWFMALSRAFEGR
jgi:hypothetical protein